MIDIAPRQVPETPDMVGVALVTGNVVEGFNSSMLACGFATGDDGETRQHRTRWRAS